MKYRYPEIEPYEHGMKAVGDGNLVYWETCGNPRGKPALVLHGGPGSGCSPGMRRLFDPAAYRIVLFDQRGCGRSTPNASLPNTDLKTNTTQHLVADIELLREHLRIDSWLVFGGSWGSTLALAYAERHPTRVSEIILMGVTTGRRAEFDWLFRGGIAPLFPEQWHNLIGALPEPNRQGDIIGAYVRLLNDDDPAVRERAAHDWCTWESATPDWPPKEGLNERFEDRTFATAFARLVTHYVSHNGFVEDGSLLRGASALADIPGVLINGRFDLQAPIGNAWELNQVWPRAELVIVDNAGHSANEALMSEVIRATDHFAAR
jgi:proline iminopeptidase